MKLPLSLIVTAIGSCCTFSIIIALVINLVNVRRFKSDPNPNSQSTTRWKKILMIITNLALISFLLHSASVTIIHLNFYPQTKLFCTWLARYLISESILIFPVNKHNTTHGHAYCIYLKTCHKQNQHSSVSLYPLLILCIANHSSSCHIQLQ